MGTKDSFSRTRLFVRGTAKHEILKGIHKDRCGPIRKRPGYKIKLVI